MILFVDDLGALLERGLLPLGLIALSTFGLVMAWSCFDWKRARVGVSPVPVDG